LATDKKREVSKINKTEPKFRRAPLTGLTVKVQEGTLTGLTVKVQEGTLTGLTVKVQEGTPDRTHCQGC
jgi:hypothetical protein